MKQRPPLTGYNHNVRHGRGMFHVQTEDSGVNKAHVFTHLFLSGSVIATKRFDYLADDEALSIVRRMQAQHKAMLKELRAGEFDERIARLEAGRKLTPFMTASAFGELVARPPEHGGEFDGDSDRTDPVAFVLPEELAEELAGPNADQLQPESTPLRLHHRAVAIRTPPGVVWPLPERVAQPHDTQPITALRSRDQALTLVALPAQTEVAMRDAARPLDLDLAAATPTAPASPRDAATALAPAATTAPDAAGTAPRAPSVTPRQSAQRMVVRAPAARRPGAPPAAANPSPAAGSSGPPVIAQGDAGRRTPLSSSPAAATARPWTPQATRAPEGLPPPARTELGPPPPSVLGEPPIPRERAVRATEGIGDRSGRGVARGYPYGNQPSADGVVVTRAAVATPVSLRASRAAAQASASERLFGRLTTEKSLDEVILAYLAEDLPMK